MSSIFNKTTQVIAPPHQMTRDAFDSKKADKDFFLRHWDLQIKEPSGLIVPASSLELYDCWPFVEIGTDPITGRLMVLPLKLLKAHGVVTGKSGYGKTMRILIRIIIQLIHMKAGAIFLIDLKGDPALAQAVLWAVNKFSPETEVKFLSNRVGSPSHYWNPWADKVLLESLSTRQITEQGIKSAALNRDPESIAVFYENVNRYLLHLIHSTYPLPNTPRDLVNQVKRHLESLDDPKRRQDAQGLHDALDPFSSFEFLNGNNKQALNLRDAVMKKQVVICSMPAVIETKAVSDFARLFFNSLHITHDYLYSHGHRPQSFVFGEEWQLVKGGEIFELAEDAARGCGMSIISSFQASEQLPGRAGEKIQGRFRIGLTGDGMDAAWFSNAAGNYVDYLRAFGISRAEAESIAKGETAGWTENHGVGEKFDLVQGLFLNNWEHMGHVFNQGKGASGTKSTNQTRSVTDQIGQNLNPYQKEHLGPNEFRHLNNHDELALVWGSGMWGGIPRFVRTSFSFGTDLLENFETTPIPRLPGTFIVSNSRETSPTSVVKSDKLKQVRKNHPGLKWIRKHLKDCFDKRKNTF